MWNLFAIFIAGIITLTFQAEFEFSQQSAAIWRWEIGQKINYSKSFAIQVIFSFKIYRELQFRPPPSKSISHCLWPVACGRLNCLLLFNADQCSRIHYNKVLIIMFLNYFAAIKEVMYYEKANLWGIRWSDLTFLVSVKNASHYRR